jgi:hypothetical protein
MMQPSSIIIEFGEGQWDRGDGFHADRIGGIRSALLAL